MSAIREALNSLLAQEARFHGPYTIDRGDEAVKTLAHLFDPADETLTLANIVRAQTNVAVDLAPMVGVSPSMYLGVRMFQLGVRAQEIYEAELRIRQAA